MPKHTGPGLSLEFLGTGTSVGVPTIGCSCSVCLSTDSKNKRLRCSVWLQTETTSVLVDTGPDFRTQILRAGVHRVDGVFITHYHADHVVGIDDLRRFNYLQKELINCHADAKTLARINQCFDYVFSDELRPGLPNLRPIEFSPGQPFAIGDLSFTPLELDHHIMPTAGFLVSRKDDSGDHPTMGYCLDCKRIPEESLSLLQGVDILILDMLREDPHPTHLCLQEALDMIIRIQPKQTYFSHMAHEVDHETLAKKLRDTTTGKIHLAYDGLVINLR